MRVFLLLRLVKPAILIALLVAAYIYVPAIGDVSGEALHVDLVTEAGGTTGLGPQSCRKRTSTTWRCSVFAKGGSDPATYSVRMRDRTCWTARRSESQRGGDRLDRRARGCVRLRDQLPTAKLLAG
jgi:hypothetical protein